MSRGIVIFAFDLAQSFIGKILDDPDDGVAKFKIVVLIYTIAVGFLGITSLTITYFFKYNATDIDIPPPRRVDHSREKLVNLHEKEKNGMR